MRWWERWFVQAPLCYGFYNGFEWVRSKVEGSREAALDNAYDIIHLERILKMFREARVQHWLLPCAPTCDVRATPDVDRYAIRFWNVYYGLMHFAVPALVLIFLYRRHYERYRLWRNTAAFMLLIALLGFWLYPLLPPRLLPPSYGFFDAAHFGGIGPIGKTEAGPMANAYAAMPSLHIGWSSWCAFAAVPAVRRRWVKVLLIAHPIATMFAVVVTANHYILDGVGGLACLGLGYLVARLVTRPRSTDGSVEGDQPAPDRTTTELEAP
jgi:hypothetical protein